MNSIKITEEDCRQILIDLKWDSKPKCNCGCTKLYFLSTRNIYKCSSCKKQFSVISDTIFKSAKITLKKWFTAIALVEGGNVSTVQLGKVLEIQQCAAWKIKDKIKKALKEEDKIVLSVSELMK